MCQTAKPNFQKVYCRENCCRKMGNRVSSQHFLTVPTTIDLGLDFPIKVRGGCNLDLHLWTFTKQRASTPTLYIGVNYYHSNKWMIPSSSKSITPGKMGEVRNCSTLNFPAKTCVQCLIISFQISRYRFILPFCGVARTLVLYFGCMADGAVCHLLIIIAQSRF